MSESQLIEYKESWRDEYLKWICGFANAQGGKLYIGVDDSGNVCGVNDAKRLSEDIPNKIVSLLGIVPDINLLQKLFLPHSSNARNKNIAFTFYKAGFIEAWGRGISKIVTQFTNAGLKEPKFEDFCGGVRVTIYRNTNLVQQTIDKNAAGGQKTQEVTENQETTQKSGQKYEKWPEKWPERIQQILIAIEKNKFVTIANLEQELGIGHTTIKKMLNEMQKENFIRRVGADKGGHWEIVEQ
ncbi:MAG: putative DNA binding domain-containing protein [Spirochaetales bacterium]|nr:putative DNA binding domain-containing protein [Spirochaetales bacterium]